MKGQYFTVGLFFVAKVCFCEDPQNTNTEITTRGGVAETGSLCYFPFKYNGIERNECILYDGKTTGDKWCSTSYHFDLDGIFGLCDLGTFCSGTRGAATSGGTANSAKCCFPFKYGSDSYSQCITTQDRSQPTIPWCGTTDEYGGSGGEWGYCQTNTPEPLNTNTETRVEGGNVQDGTLCYFPFRYNDQDHNQCIVGGKVSSRPWCGTEYNHDVTGSFGYCVIDTEPTYTCSGTTSGSTVGGTANGGNCCFPFHYMGNNRTECIRTEGKTEGPWCGTTDDVDTDEQWGYCDTVPPCSGKEGNETKDGNAKGAKCCFPFIHKNESKSECVTTDDKSEGAWCATSDDYDTDNKWGYCQDVSTEPMLFGVVFAVIVVCVMFVLLVCLCLKGRRDRHLLATTQLTVAIPPPYSLQAGYPYNQDVSSDSRILTRTEVLPPSYEEATETGRHQLF